MTSVTVPGSGGSEISESFDNKTNAALAQQMANAIAAANTAGKLTIVTATPGGGAVPAPPSNPGGVNELIINSGGDYTVPGGSPPGTPPWTVILDSTAPVTIHGSQNTSIWGGLNTDTIIDPSAIVLSESAGNAAVTVTGTGDVVAGNNHNDTLTAAGNAQSIAGGTGSNLFFSLGSNDTIFAAGKADTLVGGTFSSTFTIASTATSELASGGFGALSVTDAGKGDTIAGSLGTLNVTTSGSGGLVAGQLGPVNAVDSGASDTIISGTGTLGATLMGSDADVAGGSGPLSVLDDGTGDTIAAGAGSASISAPTTGAFVRGGAGSLTFVGGAGNSTVFGGSGDESVFGGTGTTSLFGGVSGGAMTYVNTTAGGMSYDAGSGSQTLDASLSKGGNFIWAFASFGNNSLVGGAGNDTLTAGSGSDTLAGGGGANQFVFWASNGNPNSHNVITDFSFIDTVYLADYGPSAPAAAIAGATVNNGSTTITLADNTKITFTGVTNPQALTGHILGT
jgi:Ca2+-binding RTX toxin-like protein